MENSNRLQAGVMDGGPGNNLEDDEFMDLDIYQRKDLLDTKLGTVMLDMIEYKKSKDLTGFSDDYAADINDEFFALYRKKLALKTKIIEIQRSINRGQSLSWATSTGIMTPLPSLSTGSAGFVPGPRATLEHDAAVVYNHELAPLAGSIPTDDSSLFSAENTADDATHGVLGKKASKDSGLGTSRSPTGTGEQSRNETSPTTISTGLRVNNITEIETGEIVVETGTSLQADIEQSIATALPELNRMAEPGKITRTTTGKRKRGANSLPDNRKATIKIGGSCASCRIKGHTCEKDGEAYQCKTCKDQNVQDLLFTACVRDVFGDKNIFAIGIDPSSVGPLIVVGGNGQYQLTETLRSLRICFGNDMEQISLLFRQSAFLSTLDELFCDVLQDAKWPPQAIKARLNMMRASTGLNLLCKTNTVLAYQFLHEEKAAFQRYRQMFEMLRAFTSIHAFAVLEEVMKSESLKKANPFKVMSFLSMLYHEVLVFTDTAHSRFPEGQQTFDQMLTALNDHLLNWLRFLIAKVFTRDSILLQKLDRPSRRDLLRGDFWQVWLVECARIVGAIKFEDDTGETHDTNDVALNEATELDEASQRNNDRPARYYDKRDLDMGMDDAAFRDLCRSGRRTRIKKSAARMKDKSKLLVINLKSDVCHIVDQIGQMLHRFGEPLLMVSGEFQHSQKRGEISLFDQVAFSAGGSYTPRH